MKKKRVLVFLDQASRDGVSQLLIVEYLRRKGVKVYVANQHTFIAMFERCRPHVTYASWWGSGAIIYFLLRNHHRSRIVLIDQEGGRMGETPFRRDFDILHNGRVKEKVGRIASKIFLWGPVHAKWLMDMGVVDPDKLEVVGSPRLDPYLVEHDGAAAKHLGVTLRGDPLTSVTVNLMRAVYLFSDPAGPLPVGIGYPEWAQYEDKQWHVLASMRHLFMTARAFSARSRARIVFRPGPWERTGFYNFLPAALPNATADAGMTQDDYVRNAFALLDESSSMGVDGLVAGVPVVSVQRLIPRLPEHVAGGGLYEAPYGPLYWRPSSVDEAVDLLLRAQRGELARSPRPDDLRQYLADYLDWPRNRPSSFQIGDVILKLLEMPNEAGAAERAVAEGAQLDLHSAITDGRYVDTAGIAHARGKERLFRLIPGSVALLNMKCFVGDLVDSNRQVWMRYHYYPWVYRHHDRVRRVFDALWRRHETVGDRVAETVA